MESAPTPKLYRERTSEQLSEKIAELQELEVNGQFAEQLSEAEKQEVMAFENDLGAQMEVIYSPKIIDLSISLDYLLTGAGAIDFYNTFGIPLPSTELGHEELRKFLYENETQLGKVNAKSRAEFSGRAVAQVEQSIANHLLESLRADAQIDVTTVVGIVDHKSLLSPDKLLSKITSLRDFKQQLKQKLEEVKSQADQARTGIIEVYLRRTNELLVGLSQTAQTLKDKKSSGVALTESEQALCDLTFGDENPDRVNARYDRFKHGSSTELNSAGDYRQISSSLLAYTDEYARSYNQSICESGALIREKGLESDLVEAENFYSPDEIRAFAEEVLKSYGLLSSEPVEDYDFERDGTASDGQWQVIISERFQSMSASGKQRIIKIPNKPMSAKKLFPVALAHEIEGHALQHTNKANLGLRLFEKIGSDRSVVFAEGGAKFNEDFVSREAFGVSSLPAPHYIRGMQTKLAGGNYADCLKTVYESAIEPYRELYNRGEITAEALRAKAEKEIKLSIRRARRLFRNGGDLVANDGQLTSSKDTAYLEGLVLSEKLKEANLQKYMYLTGINLDSVIVLLKSGLISTKDIKEPTFTSLDIWQREKHKFALAQSDG